MNVINVIEPYRLYEMWVFDDPKVELVAEPFVGGADTMIDQVTAEFPDAEGWLCPALLRYFEERPDEIFIQVKPKKAAA